MKKICSLIFLFLMFTSFAFSQKNSYIGFIDNDTECSFEVSDANLVMETFSRETGENNKKVIPIKRETKFNIPFLTIENKKYLCLSNDFLFYLFDKNSTPFFSGCNCNLNEAEFVYYVGFNQKIKCSSFLIEGKNEFSSEEMTNQIAHPWVEGKEGYGIGEYIYFNVGKNDEIYISIGYVDFNKPELYLENSRPKKINIYLDNQYCTTVDLEDTPNFQKIPVKINKSGVLKIEIQDVYKGTKYDDTCINMLIANMSKRFN